MRPVEDVTTFVVVGGFGLALPLDAFGFVATWCAFARAAAARASAFEWAMDACARLAAAAASALARATAALARLAAAAASALARATAALAFAAACLVVAGTGAVGVGVVCHLPAGAVGVFEPGVVAGVVPRLEPPLVLTVVVPPPVPPPTAVGLPAVAVAGVTFVVTLAAVELDELLCRTRVQSRYPPTPAPTSQTHTGIPCHFFVRPDPLGADVRAGARRSLGAGAASVSGRALTRTCPDVRGSATARSAAGCG
jgi:hypothetical protein